MAVSKKPTQAKAKAVKRVAAKRPAQGAEAKVKKIYFGGIDGDAIYKKANGLFKVDKPVILREIEIGIRSAMECYKNATLSLRLPKTFLKVPKLLSENQKMKLNRLMRQSETKQAATAFLNAKDAIDLLIPIAAKVRNTAMNEEMYKADFKNMLDGFQSLGVARFLCQTGYLNNDFSEVLDQGKIQAESKRKSDSARGGKNAHKNSNTEIAFVKECWDDWQKNKTMYKNATKFCNNMLDKCEHLTSHKNLMDHCSAWKKELSKK